jgi:hypothetical protein
MAQHRAPDPDRGPHPEVTPQDALKQAARLLAKVPDWSPFPVDLMPRAVAEYVTDAAVGLGVDPAMVAVPMVGVMGGICGTKVRLNMDPNAAKPWVIRPIFWTVAIAHSGSTKTAAWEAADDLAQLVEHALRTKNELARSAYDDDLQAWKDEDPADRGPKPKPPPERRLVVDDTTVEGLAGLLADNPNGLLLSTDELRNWFDTFARYRKTGGGSDASRWLPFHGGKRFIVDRKGKDGARNSIYIAHAAVSVTGTIQPGILARIIGDEERESGLFARLLPCMPPGRPRSWKPSPKGRKNEARLVVEEMAMKLSTQAEQEVLLEPAAIDAFMAWQHPWALESWYLSVPHVVALRTKLEEYALRLALLYFLCDHAWDSRVPELIPLRYVTAGIATAEWFHNEALRVEATLVKSGEQTQAYKDCLVWAADKCSPGAPLGAGFSARDLHRSRLADDPATAVLLIQQMEEAGLIVEVKAPRSEKGGRPTKRFLPVSVSKRQNPPDEA